MPLSRFKIHLLISLVLPFSEEFETIIFSLNSLKIMLYCNRVAMKIHSFLLVSVLAKETFSMVTMVTIGIQKDE